MKTFLVIIATIIVIATVARVVFEALTEPADEPAPPSLTDEQLSVLDECLAAVFHTVKLAAFVCTIRASDGGLHSHILASGHDDNRAATEVTRRMMAAAGVPYDQLSFYYLTPPPEDGGG